MMSRFQHRQVEDFNLRDSSKETFKRETRNPCVSKPRTERVKQIDSINLESRLSHEQGRSNFEH